MVTETEQIVKNLQKRSRAVSKKKLLDVATISANNDREVGEVIAIHTTRLARMG